MVNFTKYKKTVLGTVIGCGVACGAFLSMEGLIEYRKNQGNIVGAVALCEAFEPYSYHYSYKKLACYDHGFNKNLQLSNFGSGGINAQQMMSLQENMRRQAEMLQLLSRIAKQRHETAMSVIRNINGQTKSHIDTLSQEINTSPLHGKQPLYESLYVLQMRNYTDKGIAHIQGDNKEVEIYLKQAFDYYKKVKEAEIAQQVCLGSLQRDSMSMLKHFYDKNKTTPYENNIVTIADNMLNYIKKENKIIVEKYGTQFSLEKEYSELYR